MKLTEWNGCKLTEEVRSHLDHGTWEVIRRPVAKNIIGSKVIMKNKLTVDREIKQRKARIVAPGFTQRPGFDYHEIFAPVARQKSIRLLVSLAVGMESSIHQIDVVTAYLNAELDEELYMQISTNLKEILQGIIRNERRDSLIQMQAVKMLKSMEWR